MMKSGIISLLVLLPSMLCAQVLWEKTYLNQILTTPGDIHIDSNNDRIIISGGFRDKMVDKNPSRMFLLSTSLNAGDSLTIVQCDPGPFCDNRGGIGHLAPAMDEGLYTVGGSYLAKIASATDLTVEWIRESLLQDSIHSVHDLELLPDGLILSGTFSNIDYFINKYNFNGDKLWSRRFPIERSSTSKLVKLSDNSLGFYYGEGGNSRRNNLARVSSDGEVIFDKPLTEWVYAIAASPGNEVLMIVSTGNGAGYLYNLLKMDENGNKSTVKSPIDCYYPKAFLTNSQGELFIADAFTSFADNLAGMSLSKFKPDGSLIWKEHFKRPGFEDSLYEMKIVGQDSVYLLGTRRLLDTETSWERDLLLMLVDGRGNTTSVRSEQIDVAIKAFPNPVRREFTLAWDDATFSGLLEYQLLTIHGQLLQHGPAIGRSLSLDIEQLNPGLYLVKLLDDQGKYAVKKIVKE